MYQKVTNLLQRTQPHITHYQLSHLTRIYYKFIPIQLIKQISYEIIYSKLLIRLYIIFNLYSMPSLGKLFMLALLALLTICNGFQINLLMANNLTINLYSNGQYNSIFVEQTDKFNCSMNRIYSYAQTPQQYNANTPYFIQFTNIPLAYKLSFTLETQYKILSPSISSNSCSNLMNESSCVVNVTNNCPSEIGQFKYFDILQLQVQGMPVPFSYNVLCNSQFSTNTFQWGLVIIMLFCVCLLSIIVFYSRAWSMGGAGIKINYWIVIGFWGTVGVGGIIAEFTQGVIQPILEVGTLLIGVVGIWVCSNQLIFLFKFKILERGIQIRDIFKIRILDLVSLLIGIGVALGYFFSYKNWILNDVICISVIVAAIKIMKFTNLKIALFTICVSLAVQMTFVEIIHYTKGTSYNDLILNNYNYPFQLQLPTINPVYKQKCAWLPFTAIIYPGIFIAYLRRFDIGRNTNIYFISAISVFLLGSIIWMFISIGSVHSWPFQIVTGPTMIGLICIFAYKRRQIRTLWQGSFYDQDFANRDGLNQLLDVVNRQSNQTNPQNKQDIQLIRGSIINPLRLDRRRDSDLTIIRKFSYLGNPNSMKDNVQSSKSSNKS